MQKQNSNLTGSVWIKWLSQSLNLSVVLLLALLVASCAHSSKPVVVENRNQPLPVFHPPLPSPIHPMPVEVTVITPERAAGWADKGERYVYYGFDKDDYLSFSAWLQDVLRYIKQMDAIVKSYKEEPVK